jgi:exopolysaccharide production protein ExoZ
MKKLTINYEAIQMLRFIAAAAVALTHITFYAQTRIDPNMPLWVAGSQGVQIFFVISGFVMAYSSGAISNQFMDWRIFIWRRIVRVVPLYWLMNFIKIAALVIFPGSIFANPDFLNILFSLLFIPSRNAEGIIETFYGVGWTLNFEMFFYVLMSIFLLIRKSLMLYLVATLAILMFIGIHRQDDWPAIFYLFHPYLANFIWGLLLAKISTKIKMNNPLLGMFLIIFSGYFIFLSPVHPAMSLYGVQYAALVLGFLLLEEKLRGRIPRPIIFGGDASYSLYLTHAMTGPVVIIIASKIGFESYVGTIVFSLFCVLVVAALCYVLVEKPLINILKR